MDLSDNQETEAIKNKPLERSTRAKISDAIVILIIVIIAGILEFQLIEINPHTQYIPGLDDILVNYNFAYPNLDESIGTVGLMLIVFLPWYLLLTISTICLYFIDKQFSWNKWGIYFYLINRMIIFCFGVTLLVTDVIKLFTGSPRPYFLAVYNETNQDKTELLEARLAFPSGHSSLAMGSLFLLTILIYKSWEYTQNMYYNKSYIIGMKIYNPHSYYLCGVWWILRDVPLIAVSFVFGPIYIAIWCSLTRITDYKHFAADVVGGMMLGAAIAYITYLIFHEEMYIGFNHRLNVEIQQSRTNVSRNMDNDDPIEKNDNAVPLQQIIADSNNN